MQRRECVHVFFFLLALQPPMGVEAPGEKKIHAHILYVAYSLRFF